MKSFPSRLNEVRFASTNGFNSFDVTPRANLGAGGAAVTGLTAAAIPTLGQNEAGAQNLLIDLAGSIANMTQAFNASAGANPVFLAGEGKVRTWQQREFSWFFKDDWKIRTNLTLNLGMRYEWYGVPYEANGKAAGVVGGSKGLFGWSGTDYGDMYNPGPMKGSLTRIELVGKNSVNAGTKLYNDDWNNFAPAVGLSWSIPYFGKDKTVLRLGYGVGYEKNSLRIVEYFQGLNQVVDPSVSRLTNAQALNTRSTMMAITDANGNLIAVNPTAGVLGNFDPRYLTGPGEVRFDLNLVKRVRIGEQKEFEFRADAIGLLNRPNFGTPTTDINSTNFGRITSASDSRIIVLNARINF